MSVHRIPTDYPLIDSDPHFQRVVRFFRPSDWAWTATGPGVMVGAMYAYDWAFPQRMKVRDWKVQRTAVAFLGGVGFFFWRYQQVSHRFWGEKENAREVAKDFNEMRARIRQNLPLYGHTRLSEYNQAVAFKNSYRSADKLWFMPWFNFANHKFHSTDQDYYRGLESVRPSDYQAYYMTYA